MLKLWSLRWSLLFGGNGKGYAQERRGSMLIGDLVVAIEPAGGKINGALKKANVLRSMRNDKSQANKKPTQHGCMGSV